MDKAVMGAAVATTGGCSVVQGRSVQEMLLYVVLLLGFCLVWHVGFAIWNCRLTRKRLAALAQRRSCNGKPL